MSVCNNQNQEKPGTLCEKDLWKSDMLNKDAGIIDLHLHSFLQDFSPH